MRYVLIEVDNNNVAERLVNKFDSVKGMRIAGLFGVPTSWCGCPRNDGYYKNDIVRGDKLGWWIHITCRKARRGTHDLKNLINPKHRSYHRETGYVEVVHSVSIAEVPVQNIIPQVIETEYED